jgi:hypothetical protein
MAELFGDSKRRLSDSLLAKDEAYGQIRENTLNLTRGGQFGYTPEMPEWLNNQGYVKRNLVIVLLEIPKFLLVMRQKEKWIRALRAMVELHPRSVEGFNAGLEVSVAEHEVGGGGEFQQEFTDVKRARTEPVFNYVEKEGNVIQRFLDFWIRMALMDPETKRPLATTLQQYQAGNAQFRGNQNTDWLADWYSMSILAFEPNVSYTAVNRAWVTTNMYPLSTGEITGKRDMANENELVELSINFTGISQTSEGTKKFASDVLKSINDKDANPNLRKSFIDNISSRITPGKGGEANGYMAGVERIAEESEDIAPFGGGGNGAAGGSLTA